MRIGLASVFSFRPHVEHIYYLSTLLKEAGHEVFFLTCDSSVDLCYNRLLKNQSKAVACSLCILGGIRSYPVKNIFSVSSKYRVPLSEENLFNITASSSYSLNRIEAPDDAFLEEVIQTQKSLHSSVETFYGSTQHWIGKNKLDAIFMFNGRMDLTRAMIEAAANCKIPYISVERPWLGHGIQFNPMENCIGLKDIFGLVHEYKDKPLTQSQAAWAAKLLALRYSRKNTLEWRIFNPEAEKSNWPLKGDSEKILFTPSSRAESAGHPDFTQDYFQDITRGFDDVMNKLSIKGEQCVLRCHPIWSQKVGHFKGERPLRFFTEWAKKRGIYIIEPDSKADTYDLIRASDLVVVTGGSTGAEAAALGKRVICVGPTFYTHTGFSYDITSPNDINNLHSVWDMGGDLARTQVLRFFFTYANRYPQYVDFVRASKPTEVNYLWGANVARLEKMIATGKLEADDTAFAENTSEEAYFIENMRNQNWDLLASHLPKEPTGRPLDISRRFVVGWLDQARDALPPGDRM
ncbi:MAG: capsule biosynthesis protein [Pseudobdellovibrionaceae bacterium]